MSEPNLSNWRILVVDDEIDSIEVVKMVLLSADATVFEASNGKEGLDIFKREHPTCVLTDISMPEMDGWELLKAIRAEENGSVTPVLALTAHAMVGDKEKMLEAGFNGYMSKPLRMFTFIQDLTNALAALQSTKSPMSEG